MLSVILMCSRNTPHLEAAPQEACISFVLRQVPEERVWRAQRPAMPGAACKAEAPVMGPRPWLQRCTLGACALPTPGKVSVLAGHGLHGAVCLWPSPPRPGQRLQTPGTDQGRGTQCS